MISTLAFPIEESSTPFDVCFGGLNHGDHEVKIALIDWDDTLVPSSYLKNFGSHYMVREIEEMIITLLTTVIRSGFVPVIVTNAQRDWIPLFCERWMPALLTYLKNKNIVWLSARDEYEQIGAEDKVWKILMFNKVIRELTREEIFYTAEGKPYFIYDCDKVKIIVIGDSLYENIAVKHIRNDFPVKLPFIINYVEFIALPDIHQLKKELSITNQNWSMWTKEKVSINASFFTSRIRQDDKDSLPIVFYKHYYVN